MSVTQFSRDEIARSHAVRHLNTDPGLRTVYYLPTDAPQRDIRFLEINDLITVREHDPLEPIDFGVDIGSAEPYRLLVLDVTPAQWDQVRQGKLPLPEGWSLGGAVTFSR